MYLKEFYYMDRDLNLLAVIQAPSIIEADIVAKENNIKHFITASGGELVVHDAANVRTAVLSRDAAGFPKQVTAVKINQENTPRKGGDSLFAALCEHSNFVSRTRYNPNSIMLWKTAAGYMIVKDFDPPKFKDDKPQLPVNRFFTPT